MLAGERVPSFFVPNPKTTQVSHVLPFLPFQPLAKAPLPSPFFAGPSCWTCRRNAGPWSVVVASLCHVRPVAMRGDAMTPPTTTQYASPAPSTSGGGGSTATFRTIRRTFWTDPYIESMPPARKLLYIYLFTSPHTNNLGVLNTTTRRIAFETSMVG